jgi:hypothetical protein
VPLFVVPTCGLALVAPTILMMVFPQLALWLPVTMR